MWLFCRVAVLPLGDTVNVKKLRKLATESKTGERHIFETKDFGYLYEVLQSSSVVSVEMRICFLLCTPLSF